MVRVVNSQFYVDISFPLRLLQRWGSRNLLCVSILLTLFYRALAVYLFGGHPTYVVLNTPADWLPFVPFLAKLSTFVLGMVVAQAYCNRKGPVFWQSRRALWVGAILYLIGFVCQFYRLGWIVTDLLLPVGLTLLCMVAFRTLLGLPGSDSTLRWFGSHSYSYFLIHNFVIDRTIQLVVGDNLSLLLVAARDGHRNACSCCHCRFNFSCNSATGGNSAEIH